MRQPHSINGIKRHTTQEHARDSFENLLFSVCRFYELTGHAPANITVVRGRTSWLRLKRHPPHPQVSYSFKGRRFTDLHRAALRYPSSSFRFVGTPALSPDAEQGEARAASAFVRDPYSCQAELLAKKQERDPFAEGPYDGRCAPLAPLFDFCGDHVYQGKLPWAA